MLSEKYTHILALEMASPGNQHCANCIGTLSFPTVLLAWLVGGCLTALGTCEKRRQ